MARSPPPISKLPGGAGHDGDQFIQAQTFLGWLASQAHRRGKPSDASLPHHEPPVGLGTTGDAYSSIVQ